MERSAYASLRDLQDAHWWFLGRRRIMRSLIDQFVDLPNNADILEAGCGYGGNLSLLSAYGNLHAFEYNEQARAYAEKHTSGQVTYGALPYEIGFGDKMFDLIALLDVLEHIGDDLASLVALRNRLSLHGSILITVPALPILWSEHDVVHHHKRRYSKSHLEYRLVEAGLVPQRVGYFNSLLFPLALAQRLAFKLGTGNFGATPPPPAPINKLLTALFSFESNLLGSIKFPVGLSLYAIARKALD